MSMESLKSKKYQVGGKGGGDVEGPGPLMTEVSLENTGSPEDPLTVSCSSWAIELWAWAIEPCTVVWCTWLITAQAFTCQVLDGGKAGPAGAFQ